jgi:hypothetical protein
VPAARLAILLCLMGLAATACGGSGTTTVVETPGAAQQLVTREDVESLPSGSPERTLLAWWRHAQFAELTGYLSYFAEDVRRKLEDSKDIREQLPRFASSISLAKPEILEVEREGERATIFTIVHFRVPVGLTRFITTKRPQGFALIREQGEWRFLDDLFVETIAGQVEEIEERDE